MKPVGVVFIDHCMGTCNKAIYNRYTSSNVCDSVLDIRKKVCIVWLNETIEDTIVEQLSSKL